MSYGVVNYHQRASCQRHGNVKVELPFRLSNPGLGEYKAVLEGLAQR